MVFPSTGEAGRAVHALVVREDAHILFGFGNDGEWRLFRGLLKVLGVGPKSHWVCFPGASVEDFLRTIEAEDVAMLTRIPGIGRNRGAHHHRDARQRAELSLPSLAGNR